MRSTAGRKKIAGLSLLRWVIEADSELSGMNCRRILSYPMSSVLVLHFVGRRDRYLLLPTGPSSAFPCFLQDKSELATLGERQATEKFNRLPGRRLKQIVSHAGDRRFTLRFAPRPDKPQDEELAMVVQLMGPMPLCLLLNSQGKILETDRPLDRHPAGEVYRPPAPLDLADPQTITYPEFLHLWRSSNLDSLHELLRRRIWGIDNELAAAFTLAAGTGSLSPDLPDRALWDIFINIKMKIRSFLVMDFHFAVDPDTGAVFDWPASGTTEAGKTLNDLLCARLTGHLQENHGDKTRETWSKFAVAFHKKIKKAGKALEPRRKDAERAEEYKQCADILNIHRGSIAKGTNRVELPNPYHDDQSLTIELNAAKTVHENIETYYKKHRRALSAQAALRLETKRLAKAEKLATEIAERVKNEPADERTYPVDLWRKQLRDIGFRPPQTTPSLPRQATRRRLPYREFKLEGGEDIWVGRSARDNDELTTRFASRTDWFLHARQSKGAHVILRHDKASSPPSTPALRRAAAVAAFFSEAKHSSMVPVACAALKYVRKPRKAPPGQVALLQEETIMVIPSPPPGYHTRTDSS